MNGRPIPLICFCVLLAAGILQANGLPLVAQELAPVPPDAAQQEAVELIEEVYGEDYAQAKTSPAKTALANKLLKEARESNDPTNRYVLLRVARDMATQAGDAETALRAVGEMAESFQVDLFQLKGAVLSAVSKSASLTKHRKVLAEQALALIDEAVAKDDFVAAKYLGELAWDAARKAREAELTKKVVARNKAVREMAEAYSEAEGFFQTLKDNPVDPDANLAVGKYYCFGKGNWDRGVSMLALGSDAALKRVASKELDTPTDVEGQVALGDGWWDLAETKDGFAKERLRERAAVWYRLAVPKLSGLAKSKVEKRISEASPSPASPPPMAVAPFDAQQAKRHQQTWAEYLGVPVEMTNSIGMKFVLIPPGEFKMGSRDSDRSTSSNEKPQHKVRITRPFYLGGCEVTQAQYVRVMRSNPSKFRGSGPDAPVDSVSWEDATEFCRRLSKLVAKKGAQYRLPTEAEWEYACRAGTTTAWCFGDDEAELLNYAWYKPNTRKKTHSVGQKKPNPFGLRDIYGNVWEWCQDKYAEHYYANSPPSDPMNATVGSRRVYRGGSCDVARVCRSAVRRDGSPSLRHPFLGFRVAAVPPSKSSQEPGNEQAKPGA